MRQSILLILFLTIFTYVSATFTLNSVKAAVVTKNGENKQTETAQFSNSISNVLVLKSDDMLKVGFTISQNGEKVQPHQCFIVFTNPKSSESVTQAINVRDTGKARFELDLKSISSKFLSNFNSDDLLDISLQIGTFNSMNPLIYKFGKVQFDFPLPSISQDTKYGPKEEIHHIFSPSQKLPKEFISLAFSFITLSPLVVLFGAWSSLGVNLKAIPTKFSTLISYGIFIGSIIGYEVLLYKYWTILNLVQMLPFAGAISVIAFISGRLTLSDVMHKRLKTKA